MRKLWGLASDACIVVGAVCIQHAAFLIAPALGFAVIGGMFWLAGWLFAAKPPDDEKGRDAP